MRISDSIDKVPVVGFFISLIIVFWLCVLFFIAESVWSIFRWIINMFK